MLHKFWNFGIVGFSSINKKEKPANNKPPNKTSGKILPVVEYKDFLEDYSCGRIDIYGLDDDTYWCGKSEYSVAPMRAEDWNKLQDWLDELQTETLLTYKELISRFEKDYRKHIRWAAF